jgi:hypothetical protein
VIAALLAMLLQSGALAATMPPPPPIPAVFVQAQEPPPYIPHQNDGPLAGSGTRCYRGEDNPAGNMAHCDCEVVCFGEDPHEQAWDAEHQTGCKNYCAPERHPPACVCHADENACQHEEPKR